VNKRICLHLALLIVVRFEIKLQGAKQGGS
jgi:hypothetical protein